VITAIRKGRNGTHCKVRGQTEGVRFVDQRGRRAHVGGADTPERYDVIVVGVTVPLHAQGHYDRVPCGELLLRPLQELRSSGFGVADCVLPAIGQLPSVCLATNTTVWL